MTPAASHVHNSQAGSTAGQPSRSPHIARQVGHGRAAPSAPSPSPRKPAPTSGSPSSTAPKPGNGSTSGSATASKASKASPRTASRNASKTPAPAASAASRPRPSSWPSSSPTPTAANSPPGPTPSPWAANGPADGPLAAAGPSHWARGPPRATSPSAETFLTEGTPRELLKQDPHTNADRWRPSATDGPLHRAQRQTSHRRNRNGRHRHRDAAHSVGAARALSSVLHGARGGS